MDAVRADELVAEIVQLKAQQLHDRGGRVFNVQRDLRVAHLHDVDLLAAHLKRLGQHTDRAGDIALRHVADYLAADLHILAEQLADLNGGRADGRLFLRDAARKQLAARPARIKDAVGDRLCAGRCDRAEIDHDADLAGVELEVGAARHGQLEVDRLLLVREKHEPLIRQRGVFVGKFYRHIVDGDLDLRAVVGVEPNEQRNEDRQADAKRPAAFSLLHFLRRPPSAFSGYAANAAAACPLPVPLSAA